MKISPKNQKEGKLPGDLRKEEFFSSLLARYVASTRGQESFWILANFVSKGIAGVCKM